MKQEVGGPIQYFGELSWQRRHRILGPQLLKRWNEARLCGCG
jgi:hypothetical protein